MLLLVMANLAGARELFEDLNFSKGLYLSATDSRAKPVEVGVIFNDGKEKPSWRLAQWGTRYSLEGVKAESKNNALILENEGKRFALIKDPKGGIRVELFVKGGAEYDGKLRKQGEPWPHLLIEQSIQNAPMLKDIISFKVSFDVLIYPPQKKYPGAFDKGLHAAQFVMFFTIQNLNKKSEGYGDYLWFGVPIYDVRHKFAPAHRAKDGGKADATQKYIYALDGAAFWKKPLGDGKWGRFDADLLSYAKEAFEDAKAKGYLKSSAYEDMHISGMNTGWEVTANYDARAEFKNLSAKVEYVDSDPAK